MTPEFYAIIGSAVAVGGLILGFAMFGWKAMNAMEQRITANADKAHALIGENIGVLRNDLDNLRSDLGVLRTEVSANVGSLREEVSANFGSLREEVSANFGSLREEVSAVRSDVSSLREDVGYIKGWIDGRKPASEHN
jgi:hypothetical protein